MRWIMSKARSFVQLTWIALGAGLLTATGCGPAVTSAKPASSAERPNDLQIPQATVVSTAEDPNAVRVTEGERGLLFSGSSGKGVLSS